MEFEDDKFVLKNFGFSRSSDLNDDYDPDDP